MVRGVAGRRRMESRVRKDRFIQVDQALGHERDFRFDDDSNDIRFF